jgi:hypothetical protein
MGQAFLQQTEAESSQLLGLVGKLHDDLVLSFNDCKWVAKWSIQ